MEKRKSISKRVRFDVFKRDNFTCQYCGKQAPNIVLEVDHIKPVSKGGNNGMLNLITSCFDCNRGKSDKTLQNNQTLTKELKQMELLSQRKEQIEMMFKWQNELLKLDDDIYNKVNEFWSELTGTSMSEHGKPILQKLISKYELSELLDGIKASIKSYPEPETAFNNLGSILATCRLEKKKPYMKEIFYIRGILKNRLYYFDKIRALKWLVELYELDNVSLEDLSYMAKTVKNWSEFEAYYESY